MARTNGHSQNGFKKPDGRGKHPNSIAALRPAQPGEARNPLGRPSAGASVREHWNTMQDWPRVRIEEVVANPDAPAAQVAAAQIWLKALDGIGNELERILEHTAGKARQSVELSGALDHRHAERASANSILDDPVAREAAMTLAERLNGQATPGDN